MRLPALRLTPLLLAAAFAGLALFPLVGDENLVGFGLRLLELIAMTYSLNLVTGFLGYVDFGHVVFYGIGAYATAVTVVGLHGFDLPLLVLVLPGALVALAFGVAVGYPALRLRGAYFAIATFSINEAVLAVVLNVDRLGGSDGFPLARYLRLDLASVYYALLVVAVVMAAASYGILRGRFGLALQAIREDEDVAEAQAVDTVRYKVATYAVAGAAAAMVGGLVGMAQVLVSPEYFEVARGIEQLVIMMIGGPGTALGPLVGSLIYFLIKDSLIVRYPHLHLVFFGAIIVLIVLFLPAGLVGYFRERSARLRALLE
jgi:branched-chain amino acid transport system permease protein